MGSRHATSDLAKPAEEVCGQLAALKVKKDSGLNSSRPASAWKRLHPDLLSAILRQLPPADFGTVRLICKAWNQRALRSVKQICCKGELCRDQADFCCNQLPSLACLTIGQASCLADLTALTALSSLTIRYGAGVSLPSRLQLGNATLSLCRDTCVVKQPAG